MKTIFWVLAKIPFYQSFRAFGFPKMFPLNYTFLISSQCNSRCLTCNIWQQKKDKLTLEEWQKIFKSLGTSPFWVTISGGEPFLQPHLAEMVVALDEICRPAIINIPTNGSLVETIKRQTEKMLPKVKAKLIINLSLDGVGEEHDKIRRMPGSFKKIMASYQALKKLQKRYSHLIVGFGTVISAYNVEKARKLFDFAFQLEPDHYVTEIAEERVELGTVGLPITPPLGKYTPAIDYLLKKMRRHSFSGLSRVSRAFRVQYYQFVKDWLAGRRSKLAHKKLLPDYAGFASCEITSWGEVWPSCLKGEKMGNLRQKDYDFAQIWFSPEAAKIRRAVKKKGTSYPLANSFYTNALLHPPTMIKTLRGIF